MGFTYTGCFGIIKEKLTDAAFADRRRDTYFKSKRRFP